MDSIRVNGGRQIEVNDNGDTITLDVTNPSFISGLYGLADDLRKASQAISDMQDNSPENMMKVMMEQSEQLGKQIDGLFGDGTCMKVFGTQTPAVYAVSDFFEQVTPIMERYAQQRRDAIRQKYGAQNHHRRNRRHDARQ